MIGQRFESRRSGTRFTVTAQGAGTYELSPDVRSEAPVRMSAAELARDFIVLTATRPISEDEAWRALARGATRDAVEETLRIHAMADEIGVDADLLRDERLWTRLYETPFEHNRGPLS